MPHHDVGTLHDCPDGAIGAVLVDGQAIRLTRAGPRVHAVGGISPVWRRPARTGRANGDRVVCPWHKATFCLRTGALLEPPAVDSLPRYDVTIEADGVIVALPPNQPWQPNPPPDHRIFAIIGARAVRALAGRIQRRELAPAVAIFLMPGG